MYLRFDDVGRQFATSAIAAILLFATIAAAITITPSAVAQAAAQLWTDKSEYTQYETVIIYGSGFMPDSTVTLTATHPDYNFVTWNVLTNADGGFETQYYLDGFAETYTVTATDESGNTASTTFKDPLKIESTLSLQLNGGTSSITVNAGDTINWEADAICGSSSSTGTTTGATPCTSGNNVPDGYTLAVEEGASDCTGFAAKTTTPASPTTTSGMVTGTMTAPAILGTYCYRAHHATQSNFPTSNTQYTEQKSNTILVTVTSPPPPNVAPVANAGSDITTGVSEGTSYDFSSQFSCTDANGADTWTATVNWGDGNPTQNLGAVTCNSGTFGTSHTYADDGTYTITLTVMDNSAASADDSVSVTVGNANPTVAAGGAMSGTEGSASSSLSFTCDDAGTADTHTATVNWGYGSGDQSLGAVTCDGSTSNSGGTHTYADDTGTPFTVTITVTDDDSGTGSDTTLANIANADPTVDAGNALTGVEGTAVSLNLAEFSDPGKDSYTVTIDWGDGNTDGPTAYPGGAQVANSAPIAATHTYTDDSGAGTFLITVTVDDDDGGSGSDTTTADIDNANPTVDITTGSPQSVTVGGSLSLSFTCDDAGTADTHTATVNWGDGSGDQSLGAVTCDGSTSNSGGTHTYSSILIFGTITVTVTDDDGGSGSDTITVNAVPNFGGLLQPINHIDDGSSSAKSIFKLGSTIPGKFKLTDAAGNSIGTASVIFQIQKINGGSSDGVLEGVVSTSAADTGNCFRYDPTAEQYIFNLSTKNPTSLWTSGQVYAIKLYLVPDCTSLPSAGIPLDDLTLNGIAAVFELKK